MLGVWRLEPCFSKLLAKCDFFVIVRSETFWSRDTDSSSVRPVGAGIIVSLLASSIDYERQQVVSRDL